MNEQFLLSFHENFPSCTSLAFRNGFTADNSTSYDYLASLAGPEVRSVLDLACGDGTLLQKILKSNPQADLTGLDISPAELKLARESLKQSSVRLIEGYAQKIPLADESVEVVLCHMAFMLMDNIDKVLSEIHRCLKPEGIFSAVLSGNFELSPAHKIYLDVLDKVLAKENKVRNLNLGDSRTLQAETIPLLFKDDLFSSLEIKEFKVSFDEEPVALMTFFMMLYNVGILSEQGRKELYPNLLNSLESLKDSRGRVPHFMWLRQITCKKNQIL